MKQVYYSVTYTDGMKQYFNRVVEENATQESITEQLFENGGIRNVKMYNNEKEYNTAKNNLYS